MRRRKVLGLSVAVASFLSSAADTAAAKTATDKHRKNFMVCKQGTVTATTHTQAAVAVWRLPLLKDTHGLVTAVSTSGKEEEKILKFEFNWFRL
jgi:hypothetical protein